jgi:hypothetical protein
MTSASKIKGSGFERDATELFNRFIKRSTWKRIPGSGALGTLLGEPLLSSDISGKVQSIPRRFNVEAKVGYNSSKGKEVKQFTLKKEWLDKVKMEADGNFGIPMLVGKFSGAREGVKVFVVLDIQTFADLINMITDLTPEE